MTQENKDLLLKDLSARLPYGIVVHYNGLARPLFGIEPTQHFQITLDNTLDGEHNGLVYVSLDDVGEKPKPYLRAMESMTTEEICKIENIIGGGFTYSGGTLTLCTEEFIRLPIYKISNLIQFIYSRHLDLNNLIPMGLALEAPEGMYN